MIHSVSSVRFSPAFKADGVDLARPGKHSKGASAAEVQPQDGEKKPSKIGKAIKWLVGIVVVGGLALWGAGKMIKAPGEGEAALKGIKKYLKTAGDYISTNVIDKAANLFKSKKAAEVAEETAEKVAGAAL